jgi:hypothetical protein
MSGSGSTVFVLRLSRGRAGRVASDEVDKIYKIDKRRRDLHNDLLGNQLQLAATDGEC